MNAKLVQQEMSYDSLTSVMVYRALGNERSCILESTYESDNVIKGIHPNPDRVFSDVQQTISLESSEKLVKGIKTLHQTMRQFKW